MPGVFLPCINKDDDDDDDDEGFYIFNSLNFCIYIFLCILVGL